MKLLTIHNQGFSWCSRANARVKGYLFDDGGKYYRREELIDYFATVNDTGSFSAKLRRAKGCFAVIVETDRQLLAAVDPVRSIPLFYAVKNGGPVLGDDVYAIQQELGGPTQVDPVSREEFLRVGYTVGPRTLDPRVGQIEAGEFYVWDNATAKGSVRLFFSHAHGNYTDKSEGDLLDELDQVTSNWVRRLIGSVEGRTIVIPLSGGYDSRYIACALKREGYTNVVCYSYGVPSSFEWHIASDVCSRLGYPIHIVEYNRRNWQATIESPRFVEFCRLSTQRCAIPCIQELSAREQLEAKGALPADAVVVPGYCGDLQGGSYVPLEVRSGNPEAVLAEGINHYLFRRLFDLRNAEISQEMKAAILCRIGEYTSRFSTDGIEALCSVLEDWFTRHKVSKFVINTVRTHELFGNEWRLPLWDNELIDWWYRMPLRSRTNSTFYHRFLFERLFGPMCVSFRKPQLRQPATVAAKSHIPSALLPVAKWFYRRTLGRYYRRRMDVDAFEDVIALLIQQLPQRWALNDFGNVNGAVGVWCDAHGF